MKNTALVVLSVAAFAGLASMANATPLGVSEIANNHEVSETAKNHGAIVSEFAKHHGSTLNQAAKNSDVTSLSYQGTTSVQHYQGATAVQSVPEPRPLLLLGVGLIVLALWHQRLRRQPQEVFTRSSLT